ncbi:hypothetical protein Tco_0590581 [Tanacetum coccineum]
MLREGTASVEIQRVETDVASSAACHRMQRGFSRCTLRFDDRIRVGRLDAKMPNTRSRASMTCEEFEELVTRQVAEEMEAREATRTLEPLNENGDEQEGENGENGNRGNGGN